MVNKEFSTGHRIRMKADFDDWQPGIAQVVSGIRTAVGQNYPGTRPELMGGESEYEDEFEYEYDWGTRRSGVRV
jgi:hypothetical protein